MGPCVACSADDTVPREFPDSALRAVLESIDEPALLYSAGGRIAAVNRAATALSDLPVVGITILELLERYGAYRADGKPVILSNLPHARALRGEVVEQGERLVMRLPGGRIYRTLVTSTPVSADGRVVGALSVWHDFDAYLRRLDPDEQPAGSA
ncbi:MAG: hypothetical protein GXY82_07130 [Methanospirillum sp.]|nr:hypothetical protein [Methanospirillum sp.]